MVGKSDFGSNRGIAWVGVFGLGCLLLAVALDAYFNWGWLESVLAPICHQREERCFALGSESMAICARCLGIYLGLVVACLAYGVRPFRSVASWWILGIGIGLNGADFLAEQLGAYVNLRWLRLVFGFVLGVAIVVLMFSRVQGKGRVATRGE